jgi:hypothetical protein
MMVPIGKRLLDVAPGSVASVSQRVDIGNGEA